VADGSKADWELLDAQALSGDFREGYVAGMKDARSLCLEEQYKQPENRFRNNPRAAYQSAALRCAWVILERLKTLGT
jgi:hypothetical protein